MSKLLGINDDADACEKCGKSGLKRVMWIEDESGNISHYGTCCGARALGLNGNYSSPEQVEKVFNNREESKRNKEIARTTAQKLANQMQESIAIAKDGTKYTTVREKALNANFYLYRNCTIVEWVNPS